MKLLTCEEICSFLKALKTHLLCFSLGLEFKCENAQCLDIFIEKSRGIGTSNEKNNGCDARKDDKNGIGHVECLERGIGSQEEEVIVFEGDFNGRNGLFCARRVLFERMKERGNKR